MGLGAIMGERCPVCRRMFWIGLWEHLMHCLKTKQEQEDRRHATKQRAKIIRDQTRA